MQQHEILDDLPVVESSRASVSVLIPTFNRRDTIKQAVCSALCQTVRPLEVIVIDDGSSDGTAESLAGLVASDAIRLVVLPANRGQAAALNAGLDQCVGEFVAVLSSDDMWLPTKLQTQCAAMADDPETVLVYGNQLLWQPWDGAMRMRFSQDHFRSGRLYRDLAMRRMTVSLGASLIRREAITRVGGWDDRLRRHEDRDLTIRLARLGKFVGLAGPVSIVRRHHDLSNPKDAADTFPYEQWIEWEQMVLDKILAEDEAVLSRRRLTARYDYIWGRGWSERGQRGRAVRMLSRSLVRWPFDPRTYVILGKALVTGRRRELQGG